MPCKFSPWCWLSYDWFLVHLLFWPINSSDVSHCLSNLHMVRSSCLDSWTLKSTLSIWLIEEQRTIGVSILYSFIDFYFVGCIRSRLQYGRIARIQLFNPLYNIWVYFRLIQFILNIRQMYFAKASVESMSTGMSVYYIQYSSLSSA